MGEQLRNNETLKFVTRNWAVISREPCLGGNDENDEIILLNFLAYLDQRSETKKTNEKT